MFAFVAAVLLGLLAVSSRLSKALLRPSIEARLRFQHRAGPEMPPDAADRQLAIYRVGAGVVAFMLAALGAAGLWTLVR